MIITLVAILPFSSFIGLKITPEVKFVAGMLGLMPPLIWPWLLMEISIGKVMASALMVLLPYYNPEVWLGRVVEHMPE